MDNEPNRPNGAAADALPVLDPAVLCRVRAIMGQKFGTYVHLYLDGARMHILALRNGVETGLPAAELILPAHSLATACSQVGALQLAYLAGEVELRASALAKQGGASAVLSPAVLQLDECFRSVEPLLLCETPGAI